MYKIYITYGCELGATVPRFLLKHYSGCFCEGNTLRGEYNLNQ